MQLIHATEAMICIYEYVCFLSCKARLALLVLMYCRYAFLLAPVFTMRILATAAVSGPAAAASVGIGVNGAKHHLHPTFNT